MKILIVHDYAARYGGGENMAFDLRSALQKRGHQARVFASTAELVPSVPREADATCFGTTSPLVRVTRALNPAAARSLQREIEAFQPDVIHVRMFLTQLSPLILPVLARARTNYGTRTLFHVVNSDPICPLGTKQLPDGRRCRQKPGLNCSRAGCLPPFGLARALVQHGLFRRWLDCFDAIYANSKFMADLLRADEIPCAGYVWNGVPTARFHRRLTSQKEVVFAGRLSPEKGVSLLLEAWSLVIRQHPDAHCHVVGDGPSRPELQQQAQALGLLEKVTFYGHLPRLRLEELAQSAWFQVVPSQWEEPFGISCAEAMMRGTAVLASYAGGLAEQIVNGESGALLPPTSPHKWAGTMTQLLNQPEECERLGDAARSRAEKHFTLETYLDSWIDIYTNLKAAEPNC